MWDPEKELVKMSLVEPSEGLKTRMATLSERYNPETQEVAASSAVVASKTDSAWWRMSVAMLSSCAAGIALGFVMQVDVADQALPVGGTTASESNDGGYHELSFDVDFKKPGIASVTKKGWFNSRPCDLANRIQEISDKNEVADFESAADSE